MCLFVSPASAQRGLDRFALPSAASLHPNRLGLFFLARQKNRCQFFLKDTPCLVLDASMAQSLTYLNKMKCTMWFTSKVNRIHTPTALQDTQSEVLQKKAAGCCWCKTCAETQPACLMSGYTANKSTSWSMQQRHVGLAAVTYSSRNPPKASRVQTPGFTFGVITAPHSHSQQISALVQVVQGLLSSSEGQFDSQPLPPTCWSVLEQVIDLKLHLW